MAKVIVIANQKGGVGKSTIAVHAGFYFANKGKVLMIDLDSQGNASSTMSLSGCEEVEACASDLFQLEQLNINEPKGNMSMLKADALLNDVESIPIEAIERPKTHINQIDWADYIIIDTPPSLGRRLLGTLIAADHVITPVEPTGYATDGLKDLLATISMVKERFNQQLNFVGVLPNKVHATSKSQKEFMAILFKELGQHVIPQMIGSRVSVSDAVDTGKPTWQEMSKGGKKSGDEFISAFENIEKRMEV